MKTNRSIAKTDPIKTHEGATAQHISTELELRRSLMTCLLFENTFYEKGSEIAERIASLVPKVKPEKVAAMAIEARSAMNLRHAPLFLTRELARVKGCGTLVADTLAKVIQRADELGEFVSLYWKDKRQPLSAGVKRGLAAAFRKFDAYQLGKYNQDGAIKLRDVLFLCHAKPKDAEQAAIWKKLVNKTLESPDTWEISLSAGKDKRETFERLMREGKLFGLATLRNLRNMQQAGVDEALIREHLAKGIKRAFPYRFVVAAKHAPTLEDAIEVAMFKATEELEALPGSTGFLIDVSGSMDYSLGNHNESRTMFQPSLVAGLTETSRIDVAAGLAILLREKSVLARFATFSNEVKEIAPRRGFALRDAIKNSQDHGGTYLAKALRILSTKWNGLDRVIVITDEQSHDGIYPAWTKLAYVINVAPYENGISYGNGWTHIDGWSERVIDYIRLSENQDL